MKRLSIVIATVLSLGCSGLIPASQTRGASIVLAPRIHDGNYHTQATVSVYTSASIHHLVVKLLQGTTELASKTLYQNDLNQAITFSNLRPNTPYRIQCSAYLENNALISKDDSSYLDITTETDDRPAIASLPVHLTDINFNALGTSSIQITEGGYYFDGPEKMTVALRGIVSTLAGTAVGSGTADGLGSDARFNVPCGLAICGNYLYVADHNNHAIRKVELSTGAVTTFAGTPGATGSVDGIGTNAQFNVLTGLTTDGTYLYVSDESNHAIRRVQLSTADVTTLAGTKGATGSVDGIGTTAGFHLPYGLATDGTYLYVADLGNRVIRQIDLATNMVSTLAGTKRVKGSADGIGTDAQFSALRGITLVGDKLYLADEGNDNIRQIAISTREVTTLAGASGTSGNLDGIETNARFNNPYGITTDGTFLYVADQGNQVVRQIDISSKVVSTLAGTKGSGGSTNGTGTGARFNLPCGITMDGNYLYVSEIGYHTIRRIQ